MKCDGITHIAPIGKRQCGAAVAEVLAPKQEAASCERGKKEAELVE